LCIGLSLTSCKKEKSEADLGKDFGTLDSFMRKPKFFYDSLKPYLAEIEADLVHADTKRTSYDRWTTTVDYKWNSDSTITWIRAYKTYPIGFSREIFIHCGDSILFLHRFSTEPLGLENREDFSFLESVFYLRDTGTIKHLARISYREDYLKDTVEFRNKPFTDLTDDVTHYYSLELNYSRNIFR